MSNALHSTHTLADALYNRGMGATVARNMASRIWCTTQSLVVSQLRAAAQKKRADARRCQLEADAIEAVLRFDAKAEASAV